MQSTPRESSENNFLVLLNFIVDPAVIVDEKGRILLVNNAFEDSTGLSAKEVIGKVFLELSILPAESKAIMLENLEMRMQGLPVQPYEITFTNKNGELTYTEIKAKKISYAGQPADLVIFRDITRRKKNLAKLKEYSEKMEALVNEKVKEVKESAQKLSVSEEKYRKQFEEALDAVFIADCETGILVDCNRAASELVGREKSELIGKNQRILHPSKEIKGDFSRTFKQHIKEKEGQILEAQVITKRGEIKDVAIKANVFEVRGKKMLQGTFRDITERKKAEKKLLSSEKKYRKLFENLKLTETQLLEERDIAQNYLDIADVMLVALNTDGHITMLNRKGCAILKCTAKDALGKNWCDNFIPPPIRSNVKKYFRLVLAGKVKFPKYHENPVLSKSGDIRLIGWHNTVLRNHQGQIIGALSSGEDITEWKQAQQALVDSEEKFRNLAEQSPDMVFVNKKGRVVYANRRAEEIMGYTKEEFYSPNFNFLCLIVPESREQIKSVYERHVKNGKDVGALEYRLVTKDGRVIDAMLNSRLIKYEGDNAILGTVIDITERKKMEAEIKQKLDMLEALTQNLGVGFTIISKDYHVLWANKFIKNNVGEVEGKQCYSSLNTLDHICPDCGVKKVFEEGVAKDSHEYTNIGIHGKPYYVELIATPLKDKDGNVTAALEFVVDIAEKKHMQSELTEYSQKLEKLVDERTEELEQTQTKLLKTEKLAAIGELAAMIGHDLRNPLTGIKGAAYYLKTKCAAEIGATGREMLKTIDKAIDHSNKIINDLLEYSNKLNLELTETTPKLLLKNTLTLIEIPERTQIIDTTKNKPKIKADIGNISKVFANIITNAIDAMPGTGTLTITSKTAKGNVKIIFKDTGIGMTEETLSRLKLGFPLFTTKAKGMGFGLPICKRIVEAHGGKISLKSTLGKGTTVIVTIPVNPKTVDENEEKWIFNESMLQAMRTSQKTPRKP